MGQLTLRVSRDLEFQVYIWLKKMSWLNHSSLRNLSLANRCHSRGISQKVHGNRPQPLGPGEASSKRADQPGRKNRAQTSRSRHAVRQREAMKLPRWCQMQAPGQCFWNVSSTPILIIKYPLPKQIWVLCNQISHSKTH